MKEVNFSVRVMLTGCVPNSMTGKSVELDGVSNMMTTKQLKTLILKQLEVDFENEKTFTNNARVHGMKLIKMGFMMNDISYLHSFNMNEPKDYTLHAVFQDYNLFSKQEGELSEEFDEKLSSNQSDVLLTGQTSQANRNNVGLSPNCCTIL